jgi:hypothetical protein
MIEGGGGEVLKNKMGIVEGAGNYRNILSKITLSITCVSIGPSFEVSFTIFVVSGFNTIR